MPKGKVISDDLRWTVIRMHEREDVETISAYTGVSKRQVFRILAQYRTTGSASKVRNVETRGRKRQLTVEDVQVSLYLLF